MLNKQLIINANSSETRIALLVKGNLSELHLERQTDRGLVGNIYQCQVTRVLPGMQAAFVELGIGRSGFLYGGDVADLEAISKSSDEDDLDFDDTNYLKRKGSKTPIEKLLKQGQKILVQVAKEPLGTKGPRVTMYLTIPGRYLVLMPFFKHIGISRRIQNDKERKRLKDIISQAQPEGAGVIVRTAAEGVNTNHITKELNFLCGIWSDIEKSQKKAGLSKLLYQDLDFIPKITRELYSNDVQKIVIDDKKHYQSLKRFLTASIPGASRKLELYREKLPIFDIYGIELDIDGALSIKVDLPSGGHMIVEQTEALTSFDINTGRYVGKGSARETISKTNLEAVEKIVEQLKVRNIGGLIVIDFIDMEDTEDRDKVYNTLQEALKIDKARTNVLRVSELGLVEMTRKRTSESLERKLMEPCPLCNGRGRIKSTITEALSLIREIQRKYVQTGSKKIEIIARDDIRDWVLEEERDLLEEVKKRFGIQVKFTDYQYSLNDMNIPPFQVRAH